MLQSDEEHDRGGGVGEVMCRIKDGGEVMCRRDGGGAVMCRREEVG